MTESAGCSRTPDDFPRCAVCGNGLGDRYGGMADPPNVCDSCVADGHPTRVGRSSTPTATHDGAAVRQDTTA